MTRRHARTLMPVVALALGISAGTVAFAGSASAETSTDVVRYSAIADAYSSTSRPAYNFGTSDTLVAGRLGGDTMVSYLKFTVAAPANGAQVKGGQLTLNSDTRALPTSIRLSQVANSTWTEKSLSAKNDPALGDTIATAAPKSGAASVTFDVSSVVKGAGTYTFAVSSTVAGNPARFKSAEATSGQPVLAVTVQRVAPTEPTTRSTPPSAPSATCQADAKLVPSCGVLWGAAAGGFTAVPHDVALKTFEEKTGRTSTLFHTYHKGDELFPTKDEIAMTGDPTHPRTLLLNWKVAYGTKWANVARGDEDARIDRLATYIRANFTKKFFMVLHHEPENDVIPTAGSGMTAKDYAAMFRHTVLRLKADGVDNAVFMVAYMNYEHWNNSPWWGALYPGDDVTDWIGVDTYNNAQPGGFHSGDFNYLMNRTTDKAKFPGFYTWATTKHPGKPIAVAEWGVYDSSARVVGANKAAVYDTVLPQLAGMPAIKALVYFETAKDQSGHDIRMDDTPQAFAGFKKIAADPRFDVKL